jgi:serine/threonine-protein kinase
MRDVTPVASRRYGNESAATRAAADAADAGMLRDRVTAAFGDSYLIGKEVGRGGMAVVYSATDLRLQRTVALKVLPPDLAFRSEVRERFVREAQTAARLNHPHVVPIYAVHEAQGLVCFAMALVRGESLAAKLTREPRPSFEYIGRILEQTADALAYAHASGVVHRDIKPDNILLDGDSGRVLVTDFGIARAAESGARLTQTGIAVGTPAFMSPEQATGEREIDGRSDLYSLGVVGYLMLAGRLPFEAATTPAMLVKHLSETPPPIWKVRPDAPRMLADILDRCLAKRPDERWENAMQMRDALRGALRSGFGGSLPANPARLAPVRTVPRDVIDASRKYGHHHDDWAPRPRATPEQRAMSVLPPIPAPPVGASKREVREWERTMKEQRHELKRRWKLEREAQEESSRAQLSRDHDDWSVADRVSRFRVEVVINLAVMGMLVIINGRTANFPWAIFPIAGISMSLVGRAGRLRRHGIGWSQILGMSSTEFEDVSPEDKPQRIAVAVNVLRRHARWAVGAAAVSLASLAIGVGFNMNPMVVPMVGAGAVAVVNAMLAVRDSLRLGRLGVRVRDAFNEKWRARVVQADTRPREVRLRDELARFAGADVLGSAYGETVRGAVDDRVTIRECSERLTDADRALVPDVEPTADALIERIGSLAAALQRLEADLPGNALPQLDARIAALEAEPEHAPDRERRLSLLTRQRSSLAELDERRATMQRQFENAAMALRSLRLDMVKLRTLGVGAAIADVTNATQEARALSRDIGHAVDAAAELRRL